MLNEKAEYEFYLENGYNDLLRRENLRSELSGVRSAMTVLARGFLERCAQCGVRNIEDKHRYTLVFLKAWTAGRDVVTTDEIIMQEISLFPALAHDLERALLYNLTDHIIKQGIALKLAGTVYDSPAAIKSAMAQKVRAWENSMFSSGGKDSQNQMFFKTIIADALHKGALTNRVIALRGDTKRFGLNGKLSDSETAYMLGIVGNYLQAQLRGQVSAPVIMTQISNYIGVFASSKGKKRLCLPRLLETDSFSYHGQPLFIKTEVTGGNRKLIVNPEWIDEMDVHLEDADELTSSAYVRYSDADLFPSRFNINAPQMTLVR